MRKKAGFKILIVIILFAILVISNISYRNYKLSLQNDLGKTKKRIEQNIFRKEKIARENLESLKNYSEQYPGQNIFGLDRISKLSEKEKISFQVYNNDSLLYWSDNKLSDHENNIILFSDSNFIKINNGWYDMIRIKEGHKKYIAAILIKPEYGFENDYLVNEFSPDFRISSRNVTISSSGKTNMVKNSEGNDLFSITVKNTSVLETVDESITIILFLLEFLALLYLIHHGIRKLFPKEKRSGLNISLFVVSIIALRLLTFYFKIPKSLYDTRFFSPLYFASSEFLPSLGDLLWNSLVVLIIGVFLFQNLRFKNDRRPQKGILRISLSFIFNLLLALLFLLFMKTIRSLVVDSTISFNLNQIFSINGLSLIGLFIISCFLLSYFMFVSVLFRIQQFFNIKLSESLIGLALSLIFLLCFWPAIIIQNIHLIVCLIFFNLVFLFFRKKGYRIFHYYEIAVYLVLFTYTTYFVITVSNNFKEIENRKYFAQKLSSGEDPLAEYIFVSVRKNILNDYQLKEKLNYYPYNENDIKDYLTKKYFTGFWDKYKVQVTVCAENDSLIMQTNSERSHCYNYFNYLIDTLGKPTTCENLYLLNYGTGGYNYLSVFDFSTDTRSLRIFIELNSKFIPKGLGYPELLIDKKLFINSDLTNYSYAKYYGNNLIDAYGKYYYSLNYVVSNSLKTNDYLIFNDNGYNHLLYKVDPSSFVIISKRQEGILDILAPYSILFSFFVVILIVFFVFLKYPISKNSVALDFKNRLQIAMVSIILISFLIIGISTYLFIKNLNNNKNIDILSEKSMSIVIELQRKLNDIDTMSPDQLNVLSGFLGKLSNVFFTDINVFNTQGSLVSSSRPQIFYEGLISGRINPDAFYQLNQEKKTFFIQKEKIGELEYYSAYVPFYDRENKAVYYINLPYFAKQSELKKELSSFLMAFINIYVFFIAISIIIALFVASRITRPLNVIREKISQIRLGSKNEKILWPRRDEIGGLIEEYNRMIDEITVSASLLARSERESAWREMAMQVAHEIKNPLTPMKLSIQYLDKAWKEHAPEWEAILKRFSKNMVEQIDSLSAIASEFSYFAKMPLPDNEVMDIIPVIESSMAIFNNSDEIKLSLNFNKSERYMIFADKKQVVRVMNNLIHNAVQAIGNKDEGRIIINVEVIQKNILISIQDNGGGIPEEMKEKVFMPSFSTKTEGMGLGLAIVRGIVENSSGRIWFESVENQGTTFFIEWPQAE